MPDKQKSFEDFLTSKNITLDDFEKKDRTFKDIVIKQYERENPTLLTRLPKSLGYNLATENYVHDTAVALVQTMVEILEKLDNIENKIDNLASK